jgi:hypothetical protein
MSDELEDDESAESDPLEIPSSDAPPPASPGRRRLATIVALLFIAVILTFLVWFISSNTERNEGGGFFGDAERSAIHSSLPKVVWANPGAMNWR